MNENREIQQKIKEYHERMQAYFNASAPIVKTLCRLRATCLPKIFIHTSGRVEFIYCDKFKEAEASVLEILREIKGQFGLQQEEIDGWNKTSENNQAIHKESPG